MFAYNFAEQTNPISSEKLVFEASNSKRKYICLCVYHYIMMNFSKVNAMRCCGYNVKFLNLFVSLLWSEEQSGRMALRLRLRKNKTGLTWRGSTGGETWYVNTLPPIVIIHAVRAPSHSHIFI